MYDQHRGAALVLVGLARRMPGSLVGHGNGIGQTGRAGESVCAPRIGNNAPQPIAFCRLEKVSAGSDRSRWELVSGQNGGAIRTCIGQQ